MSNKIHLLTKTDRHNCKAVTECFFQQMAVYSKICDNTNTELISGLFSSVRQHKVYMNSRNQHLLKHTSLM